LLCERLSAEIILPEKTGSKLFDNQLLEEQGYFLTARVSESTREHAVPARLSILQMER
jgi:hypothetical protein